MFNKGDLVKCNTHYIRGIGKDLYGKIGVILDYPDASEYPVEFQFEFSGGHDCNGRGMDGYCCWIPVEDLMLHMNYKVVLRHNSYEIDFDNYKIYQITENEKKHEITDLHLIREVLSCLNFKTA